MKLSERIRNHPYHTRIDLTFANEVEQLEAENKWVNIYKVLRAAHKSHRRKLEAENERLNEAASWIFAGAINAENPRWGPCPHGNRPSYRTHAWWCDGCFEALRDALKEGG